MVVIYQKHMFAREGELQEVEISRDGSYGEFFYICHRSNDMLVIYVGDKGEYYYGAREFPRVMPAIWNIRVSATRVARHHQGRVKKFPFLLRKILRKKGAK